jgi:phospholipid transport system substrate-binding protein
MKRNRIFIVGFLLFFSVIAFASSPVAMLQNVANNMIAKLKQNQSQLKSSARVVHQIVNSTLIPYVDANRMAGMVVGRGNWYAATPNQRREFVKQFKQVVINTYSNALASFNDDKCKVYPLRVSTKGKWYTQVNSVIIRKNGQRIGISYNLIRSGKSWKIYDFSIEGVSIIQNYRSQFSGTLASGGMAKLIMRLKSYTRG